MTNKGYGAGPHNIQQTRLTMQQQIEARAGLNGSGAGRECVPSAEVDGAGHPLPPMAPGELAGPEEEGAEGRRTSAAADEAPRPRFLLVALMRDREKRAELKRRVTETDQTYQEMADWLGVSRGAVHSYVKRQAWPRPATARGGHAPPTIEMATLDQNAQLIRARLLQAIVRQVDKVDARLKRRAAEVDEKDSRVLGNLAKTLATLMQMGTGGTTSKDAEPADRGDVDQRLAERIKRWARGEQGY